MDAALEVVLMQAHAPLHIHGTPDVPASTGNVDNGIDAGFLRHQGS